MRIAIVGWLMVSVLSGCAASAPSVSVEEVHAQVLVLDAHADVEIPGAESRYVCGGVSCTSPERLRAGGVDAIVMAVAVGPGPRDDEGVREARAQAERELASVLEQTGDESGSLRLALNASDVARLAGDDRTAVILGFQNARILGRDVDALEAFYKRGVRVFGLTHMGHNDFADSSRPVYIGAQSAYEPTEEHGGLSALGEQAVQRLNDLGAVIDVSQLSKAATLQTVALSRAPVIASHSNVQALSNVQRNLSDEEIDAIAAAGGVVHVAAFRGYLFDSNDAALNQRIVDARRAAGLPDAYDYPYELYWELPTMAEQLAYTSAISDILGPGDVEVLVDHLDYIVARVGVEHVGIGNDFNHGGGIEGYRDASGARTVTDALLKRGYTVEEIGKIWSGNFLRVFAEAERQSEERP